MTYQLNVVPESDRASRVANADRTGRTVPVRYRSRSIDLDRKRVTLDTPIYRMRNIRTIVVQEAYVADRRLRDDFFAAGQENVTPQRAQHGLLVDLAKQSKANIYALLEDTYEQTEPLIATVSGVVLNGNRRLAAMRDLYGRDPRKYRNFEYVELAILPPEATEDDLAELETDLQIAPDLRLDYGWVEEARGLRYQLEDLGWDMAKARLHWRQSQAELAKRLNALDLAEEYLQLVGRPKRYELVKDDDLALQALLRNQKQRASEAESRLKAERLVVFTLLQNKGTLAEGRVYGHAGAADSIVRKILADPSLGLPDDEVRTAIAKDPDDPLAQLPEQGDSIPAPILEFLASPANWRRIAEVADEAYGELKEERKHTERTGRFGSDAQRINALASSLTLTGADPRTLGTAAAQLVSAVKVIAEALNDIRRDYPEVGVEIDASRVSEAIDALEPLGRSRE